MPEIMVDRRKRVFVTSILQFDTDVQKPNVSYMIHDLPGNLDSDKAQYVIYDT